MQTIHTRETCSGEEMAPAAIEESEGGGKQQGNSTLTLVSCSSPATCTLTASSGISMNLCQQAQQA